jgi:hypothetical protein
MLLVLIISVTLSTTKTRINYYTSTTLGNQDLAWYISWSIFTYACYNTLNYYLILSSPYTSTYTSITKYDFSYISMSTMYFSTTRSYTETLTLTSSSTLTNIMVDHYIETYSYTDFDTFMDTDILINIITDIQYSTITMKLAPSPSQLPKNKCTCVLPLCNKIDLVLLTINNIV